MATVTPTVLVSFGDHDSDECVQGLRVRTVARPWLVAGQRANPFSLRVLREIARADVVHCHQQHILMSSTAAIAARALGRRVFCSDLGGGGWDVSAYVSTDRWFHGHLHISAYSRDVAGHQGRPDAWVIHGGVDTDRFSPATAHRPAADTRCSSAAFCRTRVSTISSMRRAVTLKFGSSGPRRRPTTWSACGRALTVAP